MQGIDSTDSICSATSFCSKIEGMLNRVDRRQSEKFENILSTWSVLFNYLDSTSLFNLTFTNKKCSIYNKYIWKILLTRHDKGASEYLKCNFNLNKRIDYRTVFLQMKNLKISSCDPSFILTATKRGCAEVVDLFARHCLDQINTQEDKGGSALTYAIKLGHAQIVRTLLKTGANTKTQVEACQGTILIMAAYHGHIDVIRTLLEFGIDIEATDLNGQTVLMRIVSETFPKIYPYLKIVHQYFCDDPIPQSTLNFRKENGHIDLTLKFIDPEFKLYDECTQLRIIRDAAWKGYIEILNLLLEFKPNLEARDHQGRTALMLAAIQGNIEIVRCLLSHNANALACDHAGNSVLAHVLSRTWRIQEWRELANLLLTNGANINTPDKRGVTPLMHMLGAVCYSCHALEALFEWGANINAADCDGHTVLMHAIDHRNIGAIKKLLGAPIPPNLEAMDHNKNTAFLLARKQGNQEIIDLLSSASLSYSQKNNMPQGHSHKRLRDAEEKEQ